MASYTEKAVPVLMTAVLPSAVLMFDGARGKFKPWHTALAVGIMGIGMYVGRSVPTPAAPQPGPTVSS